MGLRLRRWPRRRYSLHAQFAWRQGCGTGRDGQSEAARPAWFHHYDRRLHVLLPPQQAVPEGFARSGRESPGTSWSDHRKEVRRRDKSSFGLGALRRPRLNLGLNDETVETLAKKSGDRRFAYDSYRRFITMYSDVVLGVGHEHFEELLDRHKEQQGYTLDTDLSADDWADLVVRYKKRVKDELGQDFPQDPYEQLWGAIGAVFGSWMNQRAITYRKLHNIPESWGTAVNVQAMVFGNMGDTSATGVAFTRNPSTGEKKLYGE